MHAVKGLTMLADEAHAVSNLLHKLYLGETLPQVPTPDPPPRRGAAMPMPIIYGTTHNFRQAPNTNIATRSNNRERARA